MQVSNKQITCWYTRHFLHFLEEWIQYSDWINFSFATQLNKNAGFFRSELNVCQINSMTTMY
jgi:hypothetical protein